jgi:hypothetical protein
MGKSASKNRNYAMANIHFRFPSIGWLWDIIIPMARNLCYMKFM